MSEHLEGATGEPFRMVIEEGKIREFAAAVRSTNPAYKGEDSPPTTSPATFLASSRLWQEPRHLPWGDTGLNRARILHGEQEFVFYGPPPAARTELVGQSRVDRVYEKAGKRGGRMRFIEVLTEYRDLAGQLVAKARSTLIETSRPPSA